MTRQLRSAVPSQRSVVCRIGAQVAALCVVVSAVLAVADVAGAGEGSTTTLPTKDVLERQKLNEEIRKLRAEANEVDSFWQRLGAILAVSGGLVTVGGLLATLWKQSSDLSRQRQLDRDQRAEQAEKRENEFRLEVEERHRQREQQEQDRQQRFIERYADLVDDLCDPSAAHRAAAASALSSFLLPDYAPFHWQVLQLIVAQLKLVGRTLDGAGSEPVTETPGAGRDRRTDGFDEGAERVFADLMVRAFEVAMRTPSAVPTDGLDLSRTYLYRADLTRAAIPCRYQGQVDMAWADLRNANLSGLSLRRLAGIGAQLTGARLSRAYLAEARLNEVKAARAQFHGSTLSHATLKGADLTEAQFQEARLASTHFEGAVLAGANFTKAVLRDAYFAGAVLDGRALRTVMRAEDWRTAHFDDEQTASIASLRGGAGA